MFDVYQEYQTRHRRTGLYVIQTSSHLSNLRTERNLQEEEGKMRRDEINTADITAIPLPASFLRDQREDKKEEGVDVMDDEEGMDTFIRIDSEEDDTPVKAVEIEAHEVTVVPLSDEVEHEMEDVTVVYIEDVNHEEEEREERLATHNEETNEEDQVDGEDEEEDIIATPSNQKEIVCGYIQVIHGV